MLARLGCAQKPIEDGMDDPSALRKQQPDDELLGCDALLVPPQARVLGSVLIAVGASSKCFPADGHGGVIGWSGGEKKRRRKKGKRRGSKGSDAQALHWEKLVVKAGKVGGGRRLVSSSAFPSVPTAGARPDEPLRRSQSSGPEGRCCLTLALRRPSQCC